MANPLDLHYIPILFHRGSFEEFRQQVQEGDIVILGDEDEEDDYVAFVTMKTNDSVFTHSLRDGLDGGGMTHKDNYKNSVIFRKERRS